jgi:nucleoside-diphosphate-sugar epimerase
MIERLAVVGSTGRVGAAICERLQGDYEVRPVARRPNDVPAIVAERATNGVDLVINAAGVAHIKDLEKGQLDRLRVGNIELPAAVAAAALRREIPMVHISSVKAKKDTNSAYARSKFEADQRLEHEYGADFRIDRLSLVVIRPVAILLPPFDAGRLRRLRALRFWPPVLTPPVRLPVLTKAAFVDGVKSTVDSIAIGDAPAGFSVRDFDRSTWGTLRDINDAIWKGADW